VFGWLTQGVFQARPRARHHVRKLRKINVLNSARTWLSLRRHTGHQKSVKDLIAAGGQDGAAKAG
jgi:hypothetical protein